MPKTIDIHLVNRPDGMPRESDFAAIERSIPDARDGEIQIQNLYMSVDPAMRPRLSRGQEINQPIGGPATGRVTQSRNPAFKEGDIVQHRLSFRQYAVCDGGGVTKLAVDPALPLTVYMHVLGNGGFVAYGGLLEIGRLKDGEQVFVSTAAGSVGSIVAQIAKIKGCTVIGSTGSDEKAAWLKSLGLDVVINYKKEPIRDALKRAATKGLDVYFDNVGGDHLNAALPRMNLLGRIPVCGMVSAYNNPGALSAPINTLSNIIYGRVTIRGFTADDFPHLRPKFNEEMTGWVKSGRIKYQETIVSGIENAPRALIGLLNGENTGKMLVKLAE
ncbi:NADP-dependent oxidoreductase [Bradyrhizobium sp. LHD-71]|uniref:NADP-dependent oxidoreductase n=1 Tax=Bradyrhizobium sp. LHD-71 TaxID=3072141 RepID=UPI00280E10D0|nr:NADP-dependent oxidoreductase [Bradyrhizobium sp. LHD-71]MDQ8728999.1 NADP-dependent oxidoreductase [Bradyrhizobium sp. LHD-71]